MSDKNEYPCKEELFICRYLYINYSQKNSYNSECYELTLCILLEVIEYVNDYYAVVKCLK